MNDIVNILWTGGLDSTFRVLELSQRDVTIQPYYLASVNPSTRYEINAIRQITKELLKRPGTKCTLLPLIVVHASQIKDNEEITAAWDKLHGLYRLGSQYDWIARFADQNNLTLELGIEKDFQESTILRCLSNTGGYSILNEEYVKVSENATVEAKLVFKNMRFPLPLFNMTKAEEIVQFKKWDADNILNLTWFCYRPVDGKPCGLCDPCQTYIEVGLGDRIPKNRLRLYYFRKNHRKLFDSMRNLKHKLKLVRKIPHVIVFQFHKLEYKLSHAVNGFWFDSVRCRQETGKRMDWRNPDGITQKLLWLNRFWQPRIKADCADKYRAKLYLEECGLQELSVPLLGVWMTPEEIDFDKLPHQFVLKTNHGCGTNIICTDKDRLDREGAREQLRSWLKIDYGMLFNERHYSKIKRCIIAEEYLPMGAFPVDYKIHCFNGEPYCFLFYPKHTGKTYERISFSLDWERRYLIKGEEKYQYVVPRPANLEKMLEYARILSKPFPYVRIDFYESDGRLYFGEFTFTPFGNVMDYIYKPEICKEMGERLVLPSKNTK